MGKIKLRYNLSRGKNYMKWKITYPNNIVEYHHPTDVQLILINPHLKNNKKTAAKIFSGAHKVVCAWILCDDIEIKTEDFIQSDRLGKRLSYNPRSCIHWRLEAHDEDMDDRKFSRIESVDYNLYLVV